MHISLTQINQIKEHNINKKYLEELSLLLKEMQIYL